MPRFARIIVDGMQARKHAVDVWSASPVFYKLRAPDTIKKWLGYIDQFLIFPIQVRRHLRSTPKDTLFIFADQALGQLVPLVAGRPHAIHVHDFMALRSALGEFPQNPTSWTGKLYQNMIRRGFEKGENFISVSEKSRQDLHRLLHKTPKMSEVVYNGLNYPFRPMCREECATALSEAGISLPEDGFLLHVGGNQWYKNRTGVLEVYEAYVSRAANPLPLWMVGPPPTGAIKTLASRCSTNSTVSFLSGLSDAQVSAVYSSARLLLFPSVAEGFGWPIAEALACGCPVITTDDAPMTEVGGDSAFYIPKRPLHETKAWSNHAAQVIENLLGMPTDELQQRRKLGFSQAAKFDTNIALDAYEKFYERVIGGVQN